MGKLGIIRGFVRALRGGLEIDEATADTGGGFNVTSEGFAPAGDDSQPLTGDYVALMDGPGTGRVIALGYVDVKASAKTGPGGKRIYARDPVTGLPVAEVWAKNDGTVVINNALGSFAMAPSGVVNINGVTIAVDGTITSPKAIAAPLVVAAGLELAGHVHAAGNPPGTTGPNQ